MLSGFPAPCTKVVLSIIFTCITSSPGKCRMAQQIMDQDFISLCPLLFSSPLGELHSIFILRYGNCFIYLCIYKTYVATCVMYSNTQQLKNNTNVKSIITSQIFWCSEKQNTHKNNFTGLQPFSSPIFMVNARFSKLSRRLSE